MCITFRKLGLIPMVMGLIHLGYAQSNKIISLEGVNIDATHRNYYKKQSDPTLRLYDNHLDAPQSVTMISSNLLQDQLAYNINESADRSISGAVREQLHNMISPDLYLRGSYATSLRNGVDVRPIILSGHGTKGTHCRRHSNNRRVRICQRAFFFYHCSRRWFWVLQYRI